MFTYIRTSSAFFLSLPPPDHLEATECTAKVRQLDSHLSLPSSQHQTTWMFTTTKVRKSLYSFCGHLWFSFQLHLQFCQFLLGSVIIFLQSNSVLFCLSHWNVPEWYQAKWNEYIGLKLVTFYLSEKYIVEGIFNLYLCCFHSPLFNSKSYAQKSIILMNLWPFNCVGNIL